MVGVYLYEVESVAILVGGERGSEFLPSVGTLARRELGGDFLPNEGWGIHKG